MNRVSLQIFRPLWSIFSIFVSLIFVEKIDTVKESLCIICSEIVVSSILIVHTWQVLTY